VRFETKAIHEGQEPDPLTGSVIVPVYQTSTYEQEAIGRHRGYEYSRTGNPTRTALEKALASLEGGKYGLAFASGQAATTAVVNLMRSGDHVVVGDDLYGGTWRLFERIFKNWGLQTTYVDVDDPDSFEDAVRENTKLIWIETPTNPLLKVIDIARLAEVASRNKLLLAVDNTFASPYFQRPLELGADIVVHSTTKYLAGHSDIVGGAVVTSRKHVYEVLKYYQNAAGGIPGPWDSWLVLRGIKTLAVRMREHESNAIYLARFLQRHPAVESVYYPGLESSPYHEIAREQMSGFGGMISAEIIGVLAEVEEFVAGLELFTLAESLGGVESLVCYPAKMTHGTLGAAERERRGIKENLVRLSVGIEDKEDLLEDLASALETIGNG